jgi:integrase
MPKIWKDKNRKRFVVDARDIGGGQPSFKTEGEAIEKLRSWTSDDVLGKFIDPGKAVNFKTCIDAWLQSNQQREDFGDIGAGELGNMVNNARHICKFSFGPKKLVDVLVSDLRAGPLTKIILPQIRVGRAPATAQKLLVHFKAIFKDAVLSEFIAYDPARDLKLPKTSNANDVEDVTSSRRGEKSLAERITRSNVADIISAADEKHRRIIEVIAFTGCRVGELRAATWDQIDFGDEDNGAIFRIDRAIKKGGKVGDPKTSSGFRSVALDDDLVTMLREWKISQPLEERGKNLIFPTREGNIADGDNWRNRGILLACKKAGVENVTLRELRHFFASILIFDSGISEASVTELMGHTDINFTKKQYATWLKSGKRDKELAQKLTELRRASN